MLVSIEFREYVLITGDLMHRKIAESNYNHSTGEVVWKNKKGDILATRKKNIDGKYENKVEENIYNEWRASR